MNTLLLLNCWSLWFLIFASRSIFGPLLPVIEAEFLVSHAQAGSLLLSLTSGMTVSFLFISSWLNQRLGYKRAILLSLLFMTLFIFLTGYVRSYDELAALCFIVGLGSGVYIPAVIPILTSAFAQRHWGKVISFHETGACGRQSLNSSFDRLLTRVYRVAFAVFHPEHYPAPRHRPLLEGLAEPASGGKGRLFLAVTADET
ncbi:MAG: MFS transporter, partial [Syntrophaceae bacterium]|nr:MFS transporter [Syntrophaceae bacterium]